MYVKWKGYDNLFNGWIDKKDIVKWIYKKWVSNSLNHINLLVETLMSKLIYLIMQKKADLEHETGINTFKLAAKSDLASLKTEIGKIGVDKLKTVPVDLSNFSNVVSNGAVKKTVHGKSVRKWNNIGTSGFF